MNCQFQVGLPQLDQNWVWFLELEFQSFFLEGPTQNHIPSFIYAWNQNCNWNPSKYCLELEPEVPHKIKWTIIFVKMKISKLINCSTNMVEIVKRLKLYLKSTTTPWLRYFIPAKVNQHPRWTFPFSSEAP